MCVSSNFSATRKCRRPLYINAHFRMRSLLGTKPRAIQNAGRCAVVCGAHSLLIHAPDAAS